MYRKSGTVPESLQNKLQPGETLEATGDFRVLPSILPFFLIAGVSFAAGRLFAASLPLLLLTNLLCMWMMTKAAHALSVVQSSCVFVTDRRIYGQAGGKLFELTHQDILQICERGGLFLDSGEARSSVMIRCLHNQKEIKTALLGHRSR